VNARTWVGAVVAVGAIAVLVGCGSSSNASTATTAAGQATGSATMRTVTQPVTTSGSTGTSTASTAVQNLQVTQALRAELLQAGAASHNLPASDYTGLAPGRTYYAYDPATSAYWAGAALVPSTSSTPAQVSVQDDGAYLVFTRPPGGSWRVYSVGMTLIPGAKCPVTVPPAVVSVWGWAPGTCRPAA